ncbi:MAG: hypothetical protein Q9227_004007 [Pyrenula ochraceoflavens]
MSVTSGATVAAADRMSSDQAYLDEGVNGVDALQAEKRYGEERAKRLREEGNKQYLDVSISDKFRHLQNDPWVDAASVKDARTLFPNNRCRVLILGGGYSGLLYAIRMVEAGICAEEIRIVDSAGGFGGTWYWNRYPGLMCDIESYSYLPLLEETGYIPRHRYSYGDEIRDYANLLAEKWGLTDSGVFHTKAETLVWDEVTKEWQVELVQQQKGGSSVHLSVRSQFAAVVNGVLNWPKLPGFDGTMDYKGKIFHSSRWNYEITGGSSADPTLDKLQDKRVAIVGTGATAVQIVPHLARWSKHLYVVQRTPAAVDHRDQRETDSDSFHKEVARAPGWQRERQRNFHQHFTTRKQPAVNLVDDGWTHACGLVAIAGNPQGPKSVEELPAYVQELYAIDLPRQNRIRARVAKTVQDPNVAKRLQPWYPSWCKRPCFHDEYLSAFNRDNVTLIDTAGKGLDRLTADSIVTDGVSYTVDLIIFATGFRAPFGDTPAERSNLTITGRDGISMKDEWARKGPSTLHGIIDHNFPNLFLSGSWQGGRSGNYLFHVDALAKHAAHIVTESERRANQASFAVAPTAAAVEDWAMQILMRAAPMGAIMGCTPSYFNLEGELDRVPPEDQVKMMRSGLWGYGVEDYLDHLEAWRMEGSMAGLDVKT